MQNQENNQIVLKNNIDLTDLLNKTKVEHFKFEAKLSSADGTIIKSLPTEIILYTDYLEYMINIVTENECIFQGNQEEIKKFKKEEQGVIKKCNLSIIRYNENILNPPGEGTSISYKIDIENINGTTIAITLNNKKEQIDIYNKITKWLYE